jgi:hypothetical protein
MIDLLQPRLADRASREEFLSFAVAYLNLLSAAYEARERGVAPAENPLSFERLDRLGVGKEVAQWILFQGHALHLKRGAWPSVAGRDCDSAVICEASAFALTEVGQEFAEDFVGRVLVPADEDEFGAVRDQLWTGVLTPSYDPKTRVFTWGRHLLKQFRQPSSNQELILQSAEELGWAAWFDDPLPRGQPANPKMRLHDTIKDLNRRQSPALVRFKGDGTGTQVGWELR